MRYESAAAEIIDRLTGLVWWRDADITDGAVTWQQALDAAALHRLAHGGTWRLANINELDTLVHAARALPAVDAPFENLREGYWSSTSSAFEPDWAWALYAAKGALGVGQKKDPHFHVLLVRDFQEENKLSGRPESKKSSGASVFMNRDD